MFCARGQHKVLTLVQTRLTYGRQQEGFSASALGRLETGFSYIQYLNACTCLQKFNPLKSQNQIEI